MANWATTSYVIEGSEQSLNKIYETIMMFHEGRHQVMNETASKDWEGNIILFLGGKIESGEYMRGFFDDMSEPPTEGVLSFSCEEAWGATDFRHALQRIFDDITIYYQVEEFGDDVFATNDSEGKYFRDQYYVEIDIEGVWDCEYFSSKEDADKFISKHTKGKIKSVDDEFAIADFNMEGENNIYVATNDYCE